MLPRKRNPMKERIFLDIATQRDFLISGAPMEVHNRADVVANIRSLMSLIRSKRLPLVSCIQAYRPGEDFNGRPKHCLDDTPGQNKMPYTLLPHRKMIESDNSLSVPLDLMKQNRQVIFRKRTEDLLGNPKADRLLNELNPERFVIFGVGLETWIRILALGLLVRQKSVCVISDACGLWDPVAADLALRQLEAKGVQLLTTDEIIKTEPETTKRRTRPIVQKLHETSGAG